MLRLVVVFGCSLSLISSVPVSPELEPRSSKKFFDKDLPGDRRPVAGKYYYFDHPYPAVQDSGAFDRDIVKDENSDGGKWQAQMEYDILRQKVRQAEKELEALKKKMMEEAAEMQEAYDKWQEALKAVRDAEAAVAEAKRIEAGANRTVDDLQDQVNNQANIVEKEMADMEKCKKNLADAKQHLKDMLRKQEAARQKAQDKKRIAEADSAEEKKRLEEKMKEEQKKREEQRKLEEQRKEEQRKKEEEQRKLEEQRKKEAQEKMIKEKTDKYEKQLAKYQDKMDKYDKKMDKYENRMDKYDDKMDAIDDRVEDVEKLRRLQKQALEDAIAEANRKDAEWKKKIAQERAEYEAAAKAYEEIMKELRETEEALDKAAANLKKYRRPPHVDDNGGVYNVPESNARSAVFGLSTLAAILVGVMA